MEAILDGKKIPDRKTLHAQLAEKLAFPAWYGGNLDALFDCLTDVSEETSLTVLHSAALQENLGPYADVLVQVLREAAEENARLHICLPDAAEENA